jgi:hypothetical protein
MDKRAIPAFVLAPLGAMAAYALLMFIEPINRSQSTIKDLLMLAPVGLFAYFIEIVIALPLFIILKRLHAVTPAICLVSALSIGVGVGLFLDPPRFHSGRAYVCLPESAAGLLSGIVFAVTYYKWPNKAL